VNRQAAGYSEYGNEISGFMECKKFRGSLEIVSLTRMFMLS